MESDSIRRARKSADISRVRRMLAEASNALATKCYTAAEDNLRVALLRLDELEQAP